MRSANVQPARTVPAGKAASALLHGLLQVSYL